MRRFRQLIMMAIALCISAVAYAQGGGKVTVSGTVTDASNLPIIGASVTIDGTDQGVMTDIDGKYSIDAASTDVLTFSYIGYVSQSVAVGARTTIDVQLAEDTQALDEVVVTGYATMHIYMVIIMMIIFRSVEIAMVVMMCMPCVDIAMITVVT